MKRIKAVIFDMDGLMFDTERIAAECFIQAGREVGLQIDETFLKYVRGSSKEAAEGWFYECYGHGYDYWTVRDRKTELLRAYLDANEIPVKKGLMELLRYLKENRYKTVLATATAEKYASQYLESAGVKQYFDDFVCGDMISRGKPDPEIFYKAAEKAGVMPRECVVLEDSLNGITAAVNGGFIPVMVPDITEPDDELESKLAAKCTDLQKVILFLENYK